MVSSRRRRALVFSLSCCLRVVVAMAALFAICPDALAAGKRTIVGTIRDYGCGEDLCYLTVVDAREKQHQVLCGAPLCGKIEKTPKRFAGRKIRATVTRESVEYEGQTDQFDVFSKIDGHLAHLRFEGKPKNICSF